MYGILSQESKFNVMTLETLGNGDNSSGGFPITGGGSGFTAPALASNLNFDFDISQIKSAASKGKGSESDIRSAYELFSTGQTSGRALGYAQDIQRRFSSGLFSTYGSTDIRTAAANYLDSVGLARLAQVVSPVPTPKETIPVDTKPVDTALPKNPFELLIDAFTRGFGNATYNPPLQSQSSGYTGVDQGVPLAEGGSSNIGTYIILAIVAIVGYFLYKRFAG
jgi:hypothetical protein